MKHFGGPSHSSMSSRPSSRIPFTLQSVFLASNRGGVVHKPPPEKVASKVFPTRWFGLGKKLQPQGKGKGGAIIRSARSKAIPVPSQTNELATRSHHRVVQPPLPAELKGQSPQDFLNSQLAARGYSTVTYKTLQTAYYNKPSKLQQASYSLNLIRLVKDGNTATFADIMASGISPNPCNAYGESLMHMVCRRGDVKFLKIMLECGAETQVADDRGRSPLHDACWTATPCFEVVQLIIERDIRLFYLADSRGALPLSYVSPANWSAWISWLESKLDTYWPVRDVAKIGPEAAPSLVAYLPNGFPLVEPDNALTLGLASLVASGRMRPAEARILMDDPYEASTTDDETVWFSDEDDDDDDDSDDDDSDNSTVQQVTGLEEEEFCWE